MGILIKYMLLGLSLAAPIGPINAAQMDKGIRSGFWHAWMVGLGATTADAIYMALVYMGLVHFLEAPMIKAFLWLFGCFVLIYTGIESFRSSAVMVHSKKKEQEKMRKCFFSGFFMSLTNPLTILFWLGIYGSVLAETAAVSQTEQLILHSSAIFGGILLWDFTMALVASGFRRFLADTLLSMISRLSGISLIGFGIYFGYQAFKFLWK
ncbi:LysE family transporter [Fictibacillus sp. S7]|uniref:LysE family transporter n=1 Tax=Fictibacillus sp. S7 TaxID=2212476 RepID=UPI001011E56C|nr:LysE family transporter [Fictibacillus sp. S7]RXY99693.1 amino acid transporter [Fictibacillus sp. S7]